MAEVMESLQRLGLRACPICGSAESLSMGPYPVLLVEGGIPPDADAMAPPDDSDGDLTFAMRVECATCGHLMLFNAQRYRTAEDKILVAGRTEDDGDAD